MLLPGWGIIQCVPYIHMAEGFNNPNKKCFWVDPIPFQWLVQTMVGACNYCILKFFLATFHKKLATIASILQRVLNYSSIFYASLIHLVSGIDQNWQARIQFVNGLGNCYCYERVDMMDLRVESWRLLHVQHTTEQDTFFLQFFHFGFPHDFAHFRIFCDAKFR